MNSLQPLAVFLQYSTSLDVVMSYDSCAHPSGATASHSDLCAPVIFFCKESVRTQSSAHASAGIVFTVRATLMKCQSLNGLKCSHGLSVTLSFSAVRSLARASSAKTQASGNEWMASFVSGGVLYAFVSRSTSF